MFEQEKLRKASLFDDKVYPAGHASIEEVRVVPHTDHTKKSRNKTGNEG